jgi:hypothetical protein
MLKTVGLPPGQVRGIRIQIRIALDGRDFAPSRPLAKGWILNLDRGGMRERRTRDHPGMAAELAAAKFWISAQRHPAEPVVMLADTVDELIEATLHVDRAVAGARFELFL